MDLFINHILSETHVECGSLCEKDKEYRLSISACMRDFEQFKMKLMSHPKCPSFLTSDAIDRIRTGTKYETYSYVTGKTSTPEWSFMYNTWMTLHH